MNRIVLFTLLFVTFSAFADHRPPLVQGTPGTPSSSFKLTTEVTSYEVEDERGMWTALAAHGTYSPVRWFGLSATVPWVRILPEGKKSSAGVGDMMMGTTFLLGDFERDNVWFMPGLGITIPTGSESSRIGSGHIELIPSFEMTGKLNSTLFLAGLIRHSASFSGAHSHDEESDGHEHAEAHDHGEHSHGEDNHGSVGSLYEPHYAQELNFRLGLNGAHDEGQWEVFVSGGMGFEDGLQSVPVVAGFWGSVRLTPAAMLFAGPSVTVGGETRFPWKLLTGLTWNFEKQFADTTGSCECAD